MSEKGIVIEYECSSRKSNMKAQTTVVCCVEVAISGWIETKISLKGPQLVWFKSFAMSRPQTHWGAVFYYVGWMLRMLVCNKLLSYVNEGILSCANCSNNENRFG